MYKEENQVEDALATLSSMYKVNYPNEALVIKMDLRDEPASYFRVEEESDGEPWYNDIKCFLHKQEYPAGVFSGDWFFFCKDLLQKISSTEMYSTKEITTWSCSDTWIDTRHT